MAVTLKQWQRAGKKADACAKAYVKRHGVSYEDALVAVLRKDAKLYQAYHQAPNRESLTELRELAEHLNAEARRPISEQSQLLAMMIGLKHLEVMKEDRERAVATLNEKLRMLLVSFVPFVKGRTLSLGIRMPYGHLATIAHAVYRQTYSALHCCRWCKNFFVDTDHRKNYCSQKCSKARATYRVKVWRAQRANEVE